MTTDTISPQAIPALGMGTFRLKDDDAYNAVRLALDAGYRHIDTAQIYGNEAQVGKAIADSGIARSDIFLTTKVWLDNLGADKFIPSMNDSLQALQTEYVDLLLIHWPTQTGGVPMSEYLAELNKTKTQGLARKIGVSNFTVAQLQEAINILGVDNIATNQIEVHPYLQNTTLRRFMKQQGIQPTAYMPLAVGKVLKDSVLQDISNRTGHPIPQLVLRWILDQGMATIPMSTKKHNLESNLAAQHIRLSPDDAALIEGLDCGERIANPGFAPVWD